MNTAGFVLESTPATPAPIVKVSHELGPGNGSGLSFRAPALMKQPLLIPTLEQIKLRDGIPYVTEAEGGTTTARAPLG